MPLLSAAISERPTGSHAIDCRPRKKSFRFSWRREKNTPTPASAARYVATITMSIGWRVCVITVLGQRADRGRLADERAHPDADVSLVPAWRQLEYGPFEIALPRGDRRGKNGFGVEVFPRAVGIRVQPEAAVRPVDARPVVHDGLHAAVVEHVHGGAL